MNESHGKSDCIDGHYLWAKICYYEWVLQTDKMYDSYLANDYGQQHASMNDSHGQSGCINDHYLRVMICYHE